MATKLPYVAQPSLMTKIMNKIKEAQTPDRFTHDYLATKLGFSGGNYRQFIPLAKKLGLLNSDGTPSDLYKKFRNGRLYPREAILPLWNQMPSRVPRLLTVAQARTLVEKYHQYQDDIRRDRAALTQEVAHIRQALKQTVDVDALEKRLGWRLDVTAIEDGSVRQCLVALRSRRTKAFVRELRTARERESLLASLLRQRAIIQAKVGLDAASALFNRIGLDRLETGLSLRELRGIKRTLDEAGPEITRPGFDPVERNRVTRRIQKLLQRLREKYGHEWICKVEELLGLAGDGTQRLRLVELKRKEGLLENSTYALLGSVGWRYPHRPIVHRPKK